MNLLNQLRETKTGALYGVLCAVLVGLSLHEFPFGRWLKELSYDLPLVARAHLDPKEALLVYMDEEAYGELKQPLNAPWDRSLHAQLLHRLTRDQARVVAFDIVFSDPGPSLEADQRFAQAIKGNGKVVLAADVVPVFQQNSGTLAKTVLQPTDLFRDNAAAIGSAEVDPGKDLIIRRHLRRSFDDQVSSLSWAAAAVAGARIAQTPEEELKERWVNYYGPPGRIPSVNYVEALSDATPPALFSNKVVFVGAKLKTRFAGERKDEYRTPYSFWSTESIYMPGVEVQATACLNLLRGDWLVQVSPAMGRVALVILGVLLGIGLIQLRPGRATIASAVAITVVALVSYHLFLSRRLLFPWLIVVAQIFAALLVSIIYNSIRLFVQKRLAEQSLGLYLSPKLVEKFASHPKLLLPGAEKQLLTVLFSDIANFSSISENLDSDDLAELMNKYFESAVSECIHKTDGTVVKYIGDAIFAFWNAPDPQVDHQLRACEAALLFQEKGLHEINNISLQTRIGLHTGVANVGNFGSTTRVDYTAIGESINLASRLEGLNKFLGTAVLISGDTHAGIWDRFVTRYLGRFRLKGFAKSIEVYELMGRVENGQASRFLRESFAEALGCFHAGQFAAAKQSFEAILTTTPADGPCSFYLRQIAECENKPLLPEWRGDIELTEK